MYYHSYCHTEWYYCENTEEQLQTKSPDWVHGGPIVYYENTEEQLQTKSPEWVHGGPIVYYHDTVGGRQPTATAQAPVHMVWFEVVPPPSQLPFGSQKQRRRGIRLSNAVVRRAPN